MKQATWKIADRLNVSWHRMGIDARTKFSTQDKVNMIDLLINGCSEPMLELHDAMEQGVVMTLVRTDLTRKS